MTRTSIRWFAVVWQWVQCPVCHTQYPTDAEAGACALSHKW